MKTPYDQAEADRWHDNAVKEYRKLHARVASGETIGGYNDPVYKKLVRVRDKLSALSRWVDATRHADYDTLPPPGDAYDAGVKARGEARSEESLRLRREAREQEHAAGGFAKELKILSGQRHVTADDIMRGVKKRS